MASGLAHKEWDDGKSPRWDAGLNVGDIAAAKQSAGDAASTLREQVNGFESGIRSQSPEARARLRSQRAPWYYDLHRSERLANAPERLFPKALEEHVRTRPIAEALTRLNPPHLDSAMETVRDAVPDARPGDVMKEFMLHRHAIIPRQLSSMPNQPPAGLFRGRAWMPDSLGTFDDVLRHTYGNHTRSSRVANAALADVDRHALVRGVTHYPSGDMILGQMPGEHDRAIRSNAKTMAEEAAHSMLARNLTHETAAFNDWKHRAHGDAGDHTHELAMAMSHAVFSEAGVDPQANAAPTDDAVAYASRLFGRIPKTQASMFRSR